jgi:hypothetical protein
MTGKTIQLEGHGIVKGKRIMISDLVVTTLDIPSDCERITFRPTGRFAEPDIEIWSCESPRGENRSLLGRPVIPTAEFEDMGDIILEDPIESIKEDAEGGYLDPNGLPIKLEEIGKE